MTSAGNWAFTYDANGNQTDRQVASVSDRAITYDGENRPTSVVTPSGTVTWVYGPDGARLKSTSSAGTVLYIGADLERFQEKWKPVFRFGSATK